MSRKKPVLLTKLELAVMRIVWQRHPEALTVREVVDALNAGRGKALAYNTVQTMLTILRDKGVVRSQTGPGRAYQYSARLSLEEVSTNMVSDLVDRLFDGNVQPLLLRLVGHESVDREALRELLEEIETQLDDNEDES